MGYATGSIAAVPLEWVDAGAPPVTHYYRIYILDGDGFRLARSISETRVASGTPWLQVFNTGTKGQKFGIEMEFIHHTVLDAILTAVVAALDTVAAFNITVADSENSINVSAIPDGDNWISYPEQRLDGVIIKGVVFRFIATT